MERIADREYYKAHEQIRVHKYNDNNGERERGIRLYSTQYGQSWELQLRSPLGKGTFGMTDGKDYVIAGASLSVEAMKGLRDAITALLHECGVE
jgi:hypothetical protein